MYAATPAQGPEADIAAAEAPLLVKVSGGLIVLAGVIGTLTGLQTLALIRIWGAMSAAPYVLVAVGLATGAAGVMVFRTRLWAAIVGTILAVLLLFATSGWLVFSTLNGLFTLFGMIAPFASFVAVVLAAVSIPACQRASAARARLAAQGLDLGI